MFSSNIQPLTMAEMGYANASEPEFKQPIGFGVRPLIQPQRLVDLDNTIHFSAKKGNQSNYRSSISAKKFTQKKPAGLSQNMSTSKKMAIQKRSNNTAIKRAIDFNNVLKRETSFVKPDLKNKSFHQIGSTTDKGKAISNLNCTNPSIGVNSVKKPQTFPTSSFRLNNSVTKKISDGMLTSQKQAIDDKTNFFNTKNKPKLKKMDNFDSSSSSMNTSSDKENGDNDKNNSLQSKISSLINSHREEIQNLKLNDNCDMPKALKKILQNNLKISMKVIKLSSKLVENNVKLIGMFENIEASKDVALQSNPIKVGEIEKKPSSRSPLQSLPIPKDESSKDFDHPPKLKDFDLRKIALLNAEKNVKYPIAKKSPLKKSMMMYTSFKSSMEFLKTPQTTKTKTNTDFETPNTRSRTVTSNNVQRQLEKLFDS